MKTLIVDDEKLLRADLRHLLSDFPALEIVGEAADTEEARQLIARLKPELIFLDVQMPEESGLDLLASLRNPPRVIFVTAFDEHALAAFEFGAIDYLLKPVEPARLRRAIARLAGPDRAAADEAVAVEASPQITALGLGEKVLLRDGDRTWFVEVSAIRGAESCGAYAKLWFEKEVVIIHRSLAFLEKRLPASLFLRANRAQLVNLAFIEKVDPWFSGSVKVRLRGGPEVEFSRRQAQIFRDRTSL